MKLDQLHVREIEKRDVDLITDYWLTSDHDFLKSLGVDVAKLPSREGLQNMLNTQINTPLSEKSSYALIWEIDGKQVGHSNVNIIEFANEAKMHLHLWYPNYRNQGMGSQLVKMSIPFYFDKLKLQNLWCEPYALNPAPNKTLEKIGFIFVKKHRTIPGSINFEQEVNTWKMTRTDYLELFKK